MDFADCIASRRAMADRARRLSQELSIPTDRERLLSLAAILDGQADALAAEPPTVRFRTIEVVVSRALD